MSFSLSFLGLLIAKIGFILWKGIVAQKNVKREWEIGRKRDLNT